MGQTELYEILKNKRLSGDYKYFSAEELRKMLKEKGHCCERSVVNNSIVRLNLFGYLDSKIKASEYRKRRIVYNAYRLKREFV